MSKRQTRRTISMTQALYEAVHARAKRANKTAAHWMADALWKALGKRPPKPKRSGSGLTQGWHQKRAAYGHRTNRRGVGRDAREVGDRGFSGYAIRKDLMQ
jgi:hypothetical protein